MSNQVKQLLIAAVLSLAGAAQGADVTVFVNGASGPWDVAVSGNPSYGVTVGGVPDSHLAPTSVSSASGLPFVAGDTVSFEYISGSALAGAGGSAWGTGGLGVLWWAPSVAPCTASPGCYVPGVTTTNLELLLGVFANSGGAIVGSPFVIGNGPAPQVIPSGATQLLMGFNDGWYNDNGAGIYVKVTEVTAVPEPETYAMLLAGLGLLGFAARRGKRRAA